MRVPPNSCAEPLLDAPQRPAQAAQRDDLLFLLFAQDIAHSDEGYSSRSMSRSVSLAGFQTSLIGRFWVTPEVALSFRPFPCSSRNEVGPSWTWLRFKEVISETRAPLL